MTLTVNYPTADDDDNAWDDDSDFDMDSDDSEEDDSLCNTVLLTGPTGCGKTSSVYALALQQGFKVLEVLMALLFDYHLPFRLKGYKFSENGFMIKNGCALFFAFIQKRIYIFQTV